MTTAPLDETTHDWPRDLQEGGLKFKQRVSNPVVFRAYMMVKMPTLGVTGASIRDLTPTSCAVELPLGWGTGDLFGRIATPAALAAAEIASASLMVINIRNQGAALNPRVVNVLLGAATPVKEDLIFTCEHGEGYGQLVADAAATGETIRRLFTVVGKTRGGQEAFSVQLEWEVAPKR